MSLSLCHTNASESDLFSFLIQSVTNAICDSPTYGIIFISVTMCNPVNIFLSSVPILVFTLGYGTSTNFMTKDHFHSMHVMKAVALFGNRFTH